MKRNDNHGFMTIDNSSPEESLKKHGLIIQNIKSDNYYCLYEDEGSYEYCILSESDTKDLINGKSWLNDEQLNHFFNQLGIDNNTFSNLPFIYQIKSLMTFFKKSDIMTPKTHFFTYDEAVSEFWASKF